MSRAYSLLGAAIVALFPLAASARRQQATPTSSEITAADLEHRLRTFAHDSMQGRALATRGLVSATQYIANELRRLGLEPLGDGASYTMAVPLERLELDLAGARLGMRPPILPRGFTPGVDFVPIVSLRRSAPPAMTWATVRYEGRFGGRQVPPPDSILNYSAVVFLPELGPDGTPDYAFWRSLDWLKKYAAANTIVVGGLELMPRHARELLTAPTWVLSPPPSPSPAALQQPTRDSLPPVFLATTSAVQLYLRVADSAVITRSYTSRASRPQINSHNVVALLRGRDAQLLPEMVVLTARADGAGIAAPEDRYGGDSVINGANAGGSGAMALLEIAERLVAERPRRSVMFVWTVGAEYGDAGAEWFVSNLNLSQRTGILASIGVDAIAGGSRDAHDDDALALLVSGAGDAVPHLTGRITELAQRPVHGVSASHVDASAVGARLRCSGLHPHFTKLGIPSAVLTGAPTPNYFSVDDDADRVDYQAYERYVRLVANLVVDLADNSTGAAARDLRRARLPSCPR